MDAIKFFIPLFLLFGFYTGGTFKYVEIKNANVPDTLRIDQHFYLEATMIGYFDKNGIFSLKGGKIRSALGLKEQLFVVDRNLDEKGKLKSFSFRGRGWGHGVGMCQYGAYGLAKMGLSFDRILKHYYTGIDLTKSYS